ncbi:MAG: hypothetical protein IJ565_03140 [Bacilli bacterium]|nr:hypothetical protein [Bacilli bacterium]
MDQNMEFINYVYEVSCMGVSSMTTLLNTLKDKDNKIKKACEDIIKGHEHFVKETKSILKKNNAEIKEVGMMAKMGSWMGIKTEMLKDNSDSRVADMIIRGLTMGLLELDKKIESFDENTDSKNKKLAKELRKFESDSIELLKPYL